MRWSPTQALFPLFASSHQRHFLIFLKKSVLLSFRSSARKGIWKHVHLVQTCLVCLVGDGESDVDDNDDDNKNNS
jgi:hypothetical protein